MSVTVTIHEGEMKQIKRLIEAKTTKGQLYGLWTHSYQPVIQYIIGDPDSKDRVPIKDNIKETHGLRHVGNWSTADAGGKEIDEESLCFVEMTVGLSSDKKRMEVALTVSQKSSNHEKQLDGVIETLEGDSGFRLLKTGPFSQDRRFQRYHSEKVSDSLEVVGPTASTANEAETKKEQWYSTEDGMQLFGKIHGALQKFFQITGTSRDTKTHDISLSLSNQRRQFSIDFPSNFPTEMAVLTEGRGKPEKIKLIKENSEGTSGKKDKQGKKKPQDKQPGRNTSQGSHRKSGQQKVTPIAEDASEDAGNEDEDETDPGSASVGNDEPQSLDVEKVPELLLQGICRLAKLNTGSRV